MVTIIKERRDFIMPRSFGAKADARTISVDTTLNSNVINDTAEAPFSAKHVGKTIWISGGLANGSPLAATITQYNSPSQVVLSANVTASAGNKPAIFGTDDTAAITNALSYAASISKAVMLDGAYITGPVKMPNMGALIGSSRNTARLHLKPGSATVDKFLIGLSANTNYRISVEDLALNGLRTYQRDGSGNQLTDIDVLTYAGATTVSDLYGFTRNMYRNLMIRDAPRAGIKYSGSGGSTFSDIEVLGGTYGADLNSAMLALHNVNVTGTGAGFYLGSSLNGSQFSNCNAYKCGYSIQPGTSGIGESACWYLNGSTNNDFTACVGQEGWASIWVLNAAARNNFSACRGADAGCLFTADGLGADNSAQIRASWYLNAAVDNRFSAVSAGKIDHATSYATHALYTLGACSYNIGRLATGQNTAWATAKVGRTHTGNFNSLLIDDEAMDINDSECPSVRQFINGELW